MLCRRSHHAGPELCLVKKSFLRQDTNKSPMKRWNGWGYSTIDMPVPPTAAPLLGSLAGVPRPRLDATLNEVIEKLPPGRLPQDSLLTADPETRLRHSRGQSLSDWLELRYGSVNTFPDAVAFPETTDQVEHLLALAKRENAVVIPYGGGTSVVGHLTPPAGDRPVLTISLSRLNRLLDLNQADHLATFQAGVAGPDLEATLRNFGYVLGHYPQSFEFSTLGGWVVTRSSGQQSLGYGRIEDLFAGGTLLSPAGKLVMPNHPASSAGPDLRQIVMGSEGKAGILSEVTVRVTPQPAHEKFAAILFPSWQQAVETAQALARSELCLSMMRVSDARETVVQLGLAGTNPALKLLPAWPERCLMLLAFTANSRLTVERDRLRGWHAARQRGGLPLPGPFGEKWRDKRFRGAYLRNTLWDLGYAVDTLETCLLWSRLDQGKSLIENALFEGLNGEGHVFSHLSHFYPSGCSLYTTYLFPLSDTEHAVREKWRRCKSRASEAIVRAQGTISHQHGVGLDHKPYLQYEKGQLGLDALSASLHTFDPNSLMNPDKLL